jgi:hypothetical protein
MGGRIVGGSRRLCARRGESSVRDLIPHAGDKCMQIWYTASVRGAPGVLGVGMKILIPLFLVAVAVLAVILFAGQARSNRNAAAASKVDPPYETGQFSGNMVMSFQNGIPVLQQTMGQYWRLTQDAPYCVILYEYQTPDNQFLYQLQAGEVAEGEHLPDIQKCLIFMNIDEASAFAFKKHPESYDLSGILASVYKDVKAAHREKVMTIIEVHRSPVLESVAPK